MGAKMGLLSRKRRSEIEREQAELWSEEEERRLENVRMRKENKRCLVWILEVYTEHPPYFL